MVRLRDGFRFRIFLALASLAAAATPHAEDTPCRPDCLSLIGLEFAYPVSEPDRSPTGGLFVATQYAHRADVEDMGALMQRVPSLVYKVPNVTAGGGPMYVDVTSAYTLPVAFLFSRAVKPDAPPWLRIPAELLVLPNSLYAMHFADHPLGYALGLSTSLYAGPGGLQPVSAFRAGVLFGLKHARFTMGAEQRFYAPKALEMPEFSYLFQIDFLPPLP
jgi:hypothetical protein